MPARDPHRFINELDAETVDRLVQRLESRGKDAVFARLLEQYLDLIGLAGDPDVLEVGCGTGVVTRALAAREGFSGRVAGIDQSPTFIATARERARAEGLGAAEYEVGDAHELPYPDRAFDVVIAHTVLSHVTDPDRVLAEMARVLAPGGTAVVFDGDYASLTYADGDPERGREVDAALAAATFNNPLVMRSLPVALPRAGLGLEHTLANVVAEVGTASYFRSFADTYAPMVASAGLLPKRTVDAWAADQYRAMEAGTFFASCNYYTVLARARSA